MSFSQCLRQTADYESQHVNLNKIELEFVQIHIPKILEACRKKALEGKYRLNYIVFDEYSIADEIKFLFKCKKYPNINKLKVCIAIKNMLKQDKGLIVSMPNQAYNKEYLPIEQDHLNWTLTIHWN